MRESTPTPARPRPAAVQLEPSRSRSASTIIRTRPSKSTVGSQPSFSRAFAGSPTSRSTSAGRIERRVGAHVLVASRGRRGRRPAPRASRRCASRRWRRRSRPARPAGASATWRRRSRRRSPSRAWRPGCPAPAGVARPSLIRATPSVTLRVTNSRPRRGRLVVEEDPRAGEHVVALAVVDRDVVAVDLGHAVGAARVERRRLASAASPAPCRTSRWTTPGRSGSSGRPGGSPPAGASRRRR